MTDYTYMDGGTGKPPIKKVKLQQKEKIQKENCGKNLCDIWA